MPEASRDFSLGVSETPTFIYCALKWQGAIEREYGRKYEEADLTGTEDLTKTASASGQDLIEQAAACLQCHKCSAGCPLCDQADLLPSQVVRLVQLGDLTTLLRSRAIWLCSSCRTCSSRCPAGVDLAGIKDALRHRCLRGDIQPGDPDIARAMETVLDSIERHGRLNELGMMIRYKIKSGRLVENAKLGIALMKRGKFKLVPSRVGEIERIRTLAADRAEDSQE